MFASFKVLSKRLGYLAPYAKGAESMWPLAADN